MSKITTPAMIKLDKKAQKKTNLSSNTPMGEAIKRLLKNKTAMAGLVIIVLLLLVAVFAPLIAPYG